MDFFVTHEICVFFRGGVPYKFREMNQIIKKKLRNPKLVFLVSSYQTVTDKREATLLGRLAGGEGEGMGKGLV